MVSPAVGFPVWLVVKIAALILLGMYLVFSLIIVKQTRLMTSTLQLGFEKPIVTLSYVHFAFSVLVFLAALVLL